MFEDGMISRGGLVAAAAVLVALVGVLLLGVGPSAQTEVPRPEPSPDAGLEPPGNPTGEAASQAPPEPSDDRAEVRGVLVLPGAQGSEAPAVEVRVEREGLILVRRSLPQGEFHLRYERPMPERSRYSLHLLAAEHRPRTIPLPDRNEDLGSITLVPGLSYGGRIVDRSGRGVPGVVVSLWWGGRELLGESTPSDGEGRFSVTFPRPPGAHVWGRDAQLSLGRLDLARRGLSLASQPLDPSGFSGNHRIEVEVEPGIRIRIVDGVTGVPRPGAVLTLRHHPSGVGSTVLDAGVTDEEGVYEPLWPESVPLAYLDVEQDAKTVRTFLVRSRVAAETLYEVRLPSAEAAPTATFSCREAGRGEPLGPGHLYVWAWLAGTNSAIELEATADDEGRAEVWVGATAHSDPAALRFTAWLYRYTDAIGGPVQHRDVFSAPYPTPSSEPIAVEVGGESDVDEGAVCWCVVSDGERSLSPGSFAILARYARAGQIRSTSLRWDEVPRPGTEAPLLRLANLTLLDDEAAEAIEFTIRMADRAPRTFTRSEEQVRAAADAAGALEFELPSPAGGDRFLTIHLADGTPARGAIVLLMPMGTLAPRARAEVVQIPANDAGEAWTGQLYPDAVYEGVVVHSGSGQAARIPRYSVDEDAGPIVLEPARELVCQALLPNGNAPRDLSATLMPVFGLGPRLQGQVDATTGTIRFPAASVGLYDLHVKGVGSKVETNGHPAPDFGFWGLVLPASRAGRTLQLRPPGEHRR